MLLGAFPVKMVLGLMIFNRKDKTFSAFPRFIFVVKYTVRT